MHIEADNNTKENVNQKEMELKRIQIRRISGFFYSILSRSDVFFLLLYIFYGQTHLCVFAVYAFIWSHEIVGRTTNFTGQNNILRNVIVSKLHFYSHHELTYSENDFCEFDWKTQKAVFHMESFKHQFLHSALYAETAKLNIDYSA